MKPVRVPKISMEAIMYQGKSVLFHDLVTLFDNFRREVPTRTAFSGIMVHKQEQLDATGLDRLVFAKTGILVRTMFSNDDSGEFFGIPPLIDGNNAFVKLCTYDSSVKQIKTNLERSKRALRLVNDTRGLIDLKSGRVNGVLSQIRCEIHIDPFMIIDTDNSTEDLAARYLHELGHLWSFFEQLGQQVPRNLAIQTAIEAVYDEENPQIRVKILDDLAHGLHAKLRDTDALATIPNKDVGTGVIVRAFDELAPIDAGPRGQSEYLARSIEFAADQFANRHGAGFAIARAMHKSQKRHGVDYGISKSSFMAIQSVRVGLVIGIAYFVNLPAAVGVTALAALCNLTAARESDSHMDPDERMMRIKNDLVQLLKRPSFPASSRQQVLQDIDAINALREDAKQHGGIWKSVYRSMFYSGRKALNVREFQKQLESLVNNDFYTAAARFRSV